MIILTQKVNKFKFLNIDEGNAVAWHYIYDHVLAIKVLIVACTLLRKLEHNTKSLNWR